LNEGLAQQLEELKEGRPWYGDGVAVKLYRIEMSKDPNAEEVLSSDEYGNRIWLTGEYRILTEKEVTELKSEWDKLDP